MRSFFSSRRLCGDLLPFLEKKNDKQVFFFFLIPPYWFIEVAEEGRSQPPFPRVCRWLGRGTRISVSFFLLLLFLVMLELVMLLFLCLSSTSRVQKPLDALFFFFLSWVCEC